MQKKYYKLSKIIAMLITVTLSTILLTGGSYAKYYINIVDNGSIKMVSTLSTTPLEVLANENIILAPYDDYIMSTFDNNIATLEIVRASKVSINVDNHIYTVYQSMRDVANAISQANITLNENDIVDLPLDKIINQDTQINITRVTTRIVDVDEIISYEMIMQPTNTLKDGEFRILQSGVDGYKKSSTFQRLYDNEVVSEEVITEEYLEAIPEIRLIGDSDYISSRIVPQEEVQLDDYGNPIDYIEKYTGKATAYSALGKPTSLQPGDVAMNLSLVPRGSKVYVKTPDNSYVYGYGEVSDTGTALVDNIILVDLFFDSYLESCLFGAKEIEVYILDSP